MQAMLEAAIAYAERGQVYVGPPLDPDSQLATFLKYALRAVSMTSEHAREQEFRDGLVAAGLDAPVAELLERYRMRDASAPGRAAIPFELRSAVYERDRYACVYCGDNVDLTLDHVLPWSRGGLDTYENLVTACRRCNSSKRAQTPSEWKGRA